MFKKNFESDPTITLTARTLSMLVAALLAFSFFIFIAGYYFGKKNATEEFLYKTDQDSFADQIYSSMCVLYDAKDENEDGAQNADDGENNEVTELIEQKEENIAKVTPPAQSSQKKYTVPLAGFSASRKIHGQAMVDRLNKKGYSAQLLEVPSKTVSGKKIIWYQVTVEFSAADDTLDTIKHEMSKIAQVNEKTISFHECA
jgi:hypothetical protein